MIEVNDYVWETIYILKTLYDHNPQALALRYFNDWVIDGDNVFEIAETTINQFFADSREYYDEEKEVSVYVFFDPLITGFWQLCDEYEERLKLKPKENKYRAGMYRALDSALYIPDYSYNALWYNDTKKKNGCRLVLLCFDEFYSHHQIPKSLCEAYDAFSYHTKQIKDAIAKLDEPENAELPPAGCPGKEAA